MIQHVAFSYWNMLVVAGIITIKNDRHRIPCSICIAVTHIFETVGSWRRSRGRVVWEGRREYGAHECQEEPGVCPPHHLQGLVGGWGYSHWRAMTKSVCIDTTISSTIPTIKTPLEGVSWGRVDKRGYVYTGKKGRSGVEAEGTSPLH